MKQVDASETKRRIEDNERQRKNAQIHIHCTFRFFFSIVGFNAIDQHYFPIALAHEFGVKGEKRRNKEDLYVLHHVF